MSKNQRKIDANQLSEEQLEQAVDKLGGKIRTKIDETCEEINGWLQRYGLVCKVEFTVNTEEAFNETSRYNESD